MQTDRLDRLIDVFEQFRKLDAELPIQIAVILLRAAKTPNMSMSHLAEATGLSLPAVSRNIARLSTARWGLMGKQKGYNLLDGRENPKNRREKLVSLTAKGKQFIQSLSEF